MDAESGEMLPETGPAASWQLHAPICSQLGFGGPEEPLQDWAVDPDCVTLNDSESEDVLHAVDPNEVFGTAAADPSSESDSGISEETPVTLVTAVTTATSQPAPATVYQVVYDISSVGGAKSEPGQENIISIELDEWSSQLLLSDSCIINELPAASSSSSSPSDGSLSSAPLSGRNQVQLFPDLRLTEEEQKLLTEEGVSLPSNLPLTKAEERILKKVRRKIRNKQSAQDSRKRRKEYIDGLESRAAACSVQNKELQRTVEQLEKHNMSLLAQLQQLRSLIKQTASKGAQTSTCLLIILVSLSLIILPSFSPFSRRPSADDDYRTTAVLSRNILTDPNFSNPTDDDAGPSARLDSSSPPPELRQSGPAGGAAGLLEPLRTLDNSAADDVGAESSQSENVTAAVAGQTGLDPGKPGHADEM
ncbi:cyclic AMP-responsive element-binding protein 3-like protein 4 [Anableps anableps]